MKHTKKHIESLVADSDTIGLRKIFWQYASAILDKYKFPFNAKSKYLGLIAVEFAINNIHKFDPLKKGNVISYFYIIISSIIRNHQIDPCVELLFDNEFSFAEIGRTLCFSSEKYRLYIEHDTIYKITLLNGSDVVSMDVLKNILKQTDRNNIIDLLLEYNIDQRPTSTM